MRTVEQIVADLKAIIDGAMEGEDGTEEERPLTDEEAARYEKLEGELQAIQKTAELRSRHTAYLTPLTGPFHEVHDLRPTGQEQAFLHYLRTGIPNQDLTPSNVEYRAQAAGTGAAGGFLVPDAFVQKIVERLKAFGGISGEAEHITTGNGNPLPWPTNDDTAAEGEIVAENAAPAGGADLVFGEKILGAYKYTSEGVGGIPLKVSYELAQDESFGLEAFIQTKLSDRIGRKQARDFAVGTGTAQPLGLLTGGTTGPVIISNVVGLTFADIVESTHVIDVAYRENGESVWVMNDAIFALVENLVDSNGRPLLALSGDSIAGSPVMTLRGHRVVVDNHLPATFGAAAKTLVFGNIKRGYIIRDVKDITMIVFRELYAATGQIGYMAWARADATVQDANAYTVIRGA